VYFFSCSHCYSGVFGLLNVSFFLSHCSARPLVVLNGSSALSPPAATASRVGGLFSYCKNPLLRLAASLSRRLETAEEVRKDLGFGVRNRSGYKKPHHPFRMLSHASGFCFRPLLCPRSSTCGLRRVRLFCLTPSLHIQTVG